MSLGTSAQKKCSSISISTLKMISDGQGTLRLQEPKANQEEPMYIEICGKVLSYSPFTINDHTYVMSFRLDTQVDQTLLNKYVRVYLTRAQQDTNQLQVSSVKCIHPDQISNSLARLMLKHDPRNLAGTGMNREPVLNQKAYLQNEMDKVVQWIQKAGVFSKITLLQNFQNIQGKKLISCIEKLEASLSLANLGQSYMWVGD